MPKPSKRALLKLANATGATVEFGGGRKQEVCVMAPKGHHFTAVGVHEVISEWTPGDRAEETRAYAAAMEDVQGGFEACNSETCPDCEWWEDEN